MDAPCHRPELIDEAQNSTNDVVCTKPSSDRHRLLYLYSGPKRDEDGFSKYCKANDFECDYIDKEFNDDHDLLDQQVWDELYANLSRYHGYLMSPPCSTFTPARDGSAGGPRPLRSADGPGRYGMKGLTVEESRKVKEGTLLARRAHDAAVVADDSDRPWVLEQPHWRHGKTSMFTLDEFQTLLERPGVNRFTLAQCRFGADAEKLTDLVSNRDLSDMQLRCNHESVWWRIPWSGEWIWGPHAPLKGRQRAIRAEEWNSDMLRDKEPSGPYLTRAYAAYPAQLNEALANKFSQWLPRTQCNDEVDEVDGKSNNLTGTLDTKFTMEPRLKPDHNAPAANMELWSLRNVYNSMTNRSKLIGCQISNLIERELEASQDAESIIWENLGRASDQVVIPEAWVSSTRCKVAKLLERNRKPTQPEHCEVDEINENGVQTVVRGHLLGYWADVIDDPASIAARWLWNGAPAGLSEDIDLEGICTTVENDAPTPDDASMATDFDTFSNYQGVEGNADAISAIHGYRDKGYLLEFENLESLKLHLGAEPILSKLGCIVKEKVNAETGVTTKKTRIILDCKQSLVSHYASRKHKSVLPRISDAVQSALKLTHGCEQNESVSLFIADVSDAFWLIPLMQSEQRFFAATLGGKYYLFRRTAQGSRGAPLTFSVIMALASRLVQSMLCYTTGRNSTPEGMLQVYVDDPLAILKGTDKRLRRLVCIISAVWMILGIPMAFHKAVMSHTVTWIGVTIEVTATDITVEVTSAKVTELISLLKESLQGNVIPIKKLRTVIGKCMSFASVIYVWRPFVQELYAALHGPTHAPNNCIWTKQVKHAINWILAFLTEEAGSIRRVYSVEQYYTASIRVQITWDASPWGMGAFLTIDGRVAEHFAIEISKDDQNILQMQSGGCEGQQLWECLSGLIAMRLWASHWRQRRVHLYLRGDNISSLVLFSTLKTHSKQLGIIAREFALDLGTACFKPEVVQHLPGIANIVADSLSRKFEPGKTYHHHQCLRTSTEVEPPPRPLTWWKSLTEHSKPAKPLAESRAWSSRKRPLQGPD